MKYAKPSLTFEEQLNLLSSRGLVVGNRPDALAFLNRVNYYRLSAYCLPFEKVRHTFEPGVRFEQVRDLYELDRRLRLIVLEAVEHVEVALGTAMVYCLSHRYGPFAHSDPKNFRADFDHAGWMADVMSETARSKETFVAHFKRTYDEFPHLPIWAAVEIMSFGSLSKLFRGITPDDKRELSSKFTLQPGILGSWLHTLVYIRNICAHHSRLWNREMAIAPRLPHKDAAWTKFDPSQHKRIASVLFLLNSILTRAPFDGSIAHDWRSRVEALLSEHKGVPRFTEAMGLPEAWMTHPLWAPKSAP